jgi:hypothetical protein
MISVFPSVELLERGGGAELICNVMEVAKDMQFWLLWQGLPSYEIHVIFNCWTLLVALNRPSPLK